MKKWTSAKVFIYVPKDINWETAPNIDFLNDYCVQDGFMDEIGGEIYNWSLFWLNFHGWDIHKICKEDRIYENRRKLLGLGL